MYKEKLNFLKVTMTTYYAIPMINKKVTRINGWSIKNVIKDWFKTYTIDHYHATRDGHRVGTNVVHKIEVVSNKEFEKQMKKDDKSQNDFPVDDYSDDD